MSKKNKHKTTTPITTNQNTKEQQIQEVFCNTENIIKKPKLSPSIFIIIIISIISGILGGVVTEYLPIKKSTINLLPQTNTPVAIPITQNEVIKKEPVNIKKLHKSVVGIYKKTNLTSSTLKKIDIATESKDNINKLDFAYTEAERVGHGGILTSDGWIITASDILKNQKAENLIVITQDKTIYEIKNPIIDTSTKSLFFKITAQNLAVTDFADLSKLNESTQSYLILNDQTTFFGTIQKVLKSKNQTKKDLIKSSEIPSRYIEFINPFGNDSIGSPIFTEKGDFIGILNEKNKVLPIEFIKPILKQVFKNNSIERPILGINYINLFDLTTQENKTKQKGVYIYEDKKNKIQATLPNSPANLAGLKAGDIILNIDDEELNEKTDVAEIIQEYKKGDKIKLTILQNKENSSSEEKEEKEIDITLK